MDSRKLTHYLVAGPENCIVKSFDDTVSDALRAGFCCFQLRSKELSDREMLRLAKHVSEIIANLGKSEEVLFLVDDRVGVAEEARKRGIKVDGVHVGQSDEKPDVCRRILGEEAVIGLSTPQNNLTEFLRNADLSCVDYLGVAPLHETETKKDLVKDCNNRTLISSFEEITHFAKNCRLPAVVGGGVKKEDLPLLAKSAVAGYFIVSAVTAAKDPYAAAKELVQTWNSNRI